MQGAMALMRVRHLSFIVMILCIFVFVTGIFSYFVGCVAAIAAFFGALVAFHRTESEELLAYGVHPCFGGLCGCGPMSEIHSARLSFMTGAFLSAVSFVIALVFAFDDDLDDWLVAMRIICAATSFLLLVAGIGALGSLQVAINLFLITPIASRAAAAPPGMYATPPRYEHRAVAMNTPPPTSSAPRYVNDPYDDMAYEDVVPVAPTSRSPQPRYTAQRGGDQYYQQASPQPQYVQPQPQPRRVMRQAPRSGSNLRPLSSYDPETQAQARASSMRSGRRSPNY